MNTLPFDVIRPLANAAQSGTFCSLPALEETGIGAISRLPMSIRIVLESVLRHCDGKKVTEAHVRELANWKANAPRQEEIPFVVARIVLQDLTGIPLLADLAAMRSAATDQKKDPAVIEPLVPVDMVVDHSVMIDNYGTSDALDLNMKIEFKRNIERYRFMKWGMQAFKTFRVVPPGNGIVHQVNLEYLAPGVHEKNGMFYPDSLVGTDSHTTMINGIGVVAWGVGGIEAEAGMLGQPLYFLTPDVIGVELRGQLPEGTTATDLVLMITELLRREKVVGKFVEFFGEGAATLSVPDRATIANMAPEYGATMGFFPVDEATVDYLRATGRSEAALKNFEAYFKAQKMFGMPKRGEIDYTKVLQFDLATVQPSLAGPKRPQDRIELSQMKNTFTRLFSAPVADNGFAQKPDALAQRVPLKNEKTDIGSGDVLIAAITSCTNTSNPGVLLAAGLLAKKAVERGLTIKPHIKTSLAPGSRAVTDYLTRAGLLPYLEKLGFYVAGYGCTTCIGNAGDLAADILEVIAANDLICAAVLSGNRNFEARIHPSIRANFLVSPPLVVAWAIAGNVNKDLTQEPLGVGKDGQPVFLKDIWPTSKEIAEVMPYAQNPQAFRKVYDTMNDASPLWNDIDGVTGATYPWTESTYIAKPPFFDSFSMTPTTRLGIKNARPLGIFGDSITTDHISPAGSIKETAPAGLWLKAHGVAKADFNSYGSRRGHHEVMMRGTFANVRIKNLMLPPKDDGTREEGGLTLLEPSGKKMPIFDAAMQYQVKKIPTIILGGEEYGTGSSRDWAAKGTQLLGVRAVITKSFERIHRANLVGMGVLPLQFMPKDGVEELGIRGDETFEIRGIENLAPQQEVTLVITRADGTQKEVTLKSRIDTPIEVEYYLNGGILPYVLRELLAK
ncbi:MAG: aconitate hydratase AcnA [Burkholderiales bacterium]|jgi:aconitate hydratase|nr:aconitate hydratase AcnA [Burkholderiales bacterium]